eukprot:5195666-Pyramimonas_sp.AAC.1
MTTPRHVNIKEILTASTKKKNFLPRGLWRRNRSGSARSTALASRRGACSDFHQRPADTTLHSLFMSSGLISLKSEGGVLVSGR